MKYYAVLSSPVTREVVRIEHASDEAPWSYCLDANALMEPLSDYDGRWPEAPHSRAVLIADDGRLAWRDDRTLAEAKASAWERVKARRAELDAMPVAVDDIELDGDERSRIDMLGAVVAMMLTGQAERAWRCADNVMRTLSAAQIQRAALAIADRRQLLIEATDRLWQQLLAASTNADADAVAWPS